MTRVDAATNTVTVIPLPGAALQPGPTQGYAGPASMAFTAGKVWFGNPAGVYEIDPATNKATLLKIPIGNFSQLGGISVVGGAGSVWGAHVGVGGDEDRLPATGQVLGHYPVPGGRGRRGHRGRVRIAVGRQLRPGHRLASLDHVAKAGAGVRPVEVVRARSA